ncbi:MAG: pyruvate kinase [Oscillospiraceae bacterium]
MRKTKIICTLGPASSDEKTIEQLVFSGMDVARFNFSHGSHEEHLERYKIVDKIRTKLNKSIGTLLDTKGPEIRLKKFKNGKAFLNSNSVFTLKSKCDEDGDESQCAISYPQLYKDVCVGTKILLDDGLIELKVIEISNEDIICSVINGGDISDRKGINIPGVSLSLPFISQNDYNDIVFGIETGFDFIAASFVRTAEDIAQIRQILEDHNCNTIKIIAKIENAQGVENIDEILRISDGIMIARGDMGVEIPLEEVPIIQKLLIKKAYMVGKHVITATQMLDSMIKNPRPTRAEATDVANAIYDGTSAIMLSGETAAGKYPIESVRTMALIATRTEKDVDYKSRYFSTDDIGSYTAHDVTHAISHATCTTAYDLNASAIITVTKSGHTARMCSRFRVDKPIIACTPSINTFRQLSMSWGVTPLMVDFKDNYEELFTHAIDITSAAGYVKDGELVVLTAGVPIGVAGTTNLLKVQMVGNIIITGQSVTQKSKVGTLCVCKDENEAIKNFRPDNILVIPKTSNNILPLLKKASGIITEEGGVNSHSAIVGMTLDIPVIVGAENATSILKTGSTVLLDAKKGIVCNSVNA